MRGARHGEGAGEERSARSGANISAALRDSRSSIPPAARAPFWSRRSTRWRPNIARADKALAALGETLDFDIFDEIVTKNLYGVDLNAESVEITRLSLWLKTARRDHRLQNLEATIRVGDSLIEDAEFTARPFDWKAAFPEVFARGGFDVVIGNPPYVRMELIKPVKPYLDEHYKVAADRADLYAYFYRAGRRFVEDGRAARVHFVLDLLPHRLGREPARVPDRRRRRSRSIVDFGDLQLFEGVTTYPAILSLSERRRRRIGRARLFHRRRTTSPNELGRAFAAKARGKCRARGCRRRVVAAGGRRSGARCATRSRMGARRSARSTARRCMASRPASTRPSSSTRRRATGWSRPIRNRSELLKPFLRGENIKRWRVEPEGLWLINTPKGKVDIEDLSGRPRLAAAVQAGTGSAGDQTGMVGVAAGAVGVSAEARGGQNCLWPHFQSHASFCIEREARVAEQQMFLHPCDRRLTLCAFLNCKLAWVELMSQARIKRGGYIEAEAQYVERLPIPDMPPASRDRLAALGEANTVAARTRFEIQSAVRRRILDLAPPERAKLTGKLEDWHELDFSAFRSEVKRAFRVDIPLRERGEWETYLDENRAKVRALTDQISAAEREIDAIVYSLFGLRWRRSRCSKNRWRGQY